MSSSSNSYLRSDGFIRLSATMAYRTTIHLQGNIVKVVCIWGRMCSVFAPIFYIILNKFRLIFILPVPILCTRVYIINYISSIGYVFISAEEKCMFFSFGATAPISQFGPWSISMKLSVSLRFYRS
jgi:hypothetical protein